MKAHLNLGLAAALLALGAAPAVPAETPAEENPAVTVTAATQPASRNFLMSRTDATPNVPLVSFSVTGGQGAAIRDVLVHVSSKKVPPDTIHLFEDGTRLVSMKTPSGDPEGFSIPIKATKSSALMRTFSIRADFPATEKSSTVHAEIIGIRYTTAENQGMQTRILREPITGPYQHLMQVVADWTIVGKPAVSAKKTKAGVIAEAEASFEYAVAAAGGNVSLPRGDWKDVIVVAIKGKDEDAVITACPGISVVTVPGGIIADGSVASVTIKATLPMSLITEAGKYQFRICSVHWTSAKPAGSEKEHAVEDDTDVRQTWGFNEVTDPVILIPEPQAQPR